MLVKADKYRVRHDCEMLWYGITALMSSSSLIPDEIYAKLLEVEELLAKEIHGGYCLKIYIDKRGDICEEVVAPHYSHRDRHISKN